MLCFGDQVLLRSDRDRQRQPTPMLVVDFEDGWPIVAYKVDGKAFEARVAAHCLWVRRRGHVIARQFPGR